jgi:hypothetical protein
LASVRELLVLDGTLLDGITLKLYKNMAIYLVNRESLIVPCYKRHMEPDSSSFSAEEDHNAENYKRRRKKRMGLKKKIKW